MTLVLAVVAALAAAAPTGVTTGFVERNFVSGQERPMQVSHAPVAALPAHRVDGGNLALPAALPALPVRGSEMSPLMRARDVFDIGAFPARAVAKLFQLDATGKRTGVACTAEFIGPRHLVTAGHCLLSPATGKFHEGFEVAAGWDHGAPASGAASVLRGWVRAEQASPGSSANQLITPERCHDMAVVEISRPLGEATGWLGLSDRSVTPATLLYRFSYPQQTDFKTLADLRDKPGQLEQVRKALDTMIDGARLHDPDFSPDNLYFEYGRITRAEGRFVAERSSYSLPGRSGSALVDADGSIVALLSRGYLGEVFSCRLTAGDIGAVKALMGT